MLELEIACLKEAAAQMQRQHTNALRSLIALVAQCGGEAELPHDLLARSFAVGTYLDYAETPAGVRLAIRQREAQE